MRNLGYNFYIKATHLLKQEELGKRFFQILLCDQCDWDDCPCIEEIYTMHECIRVLKMMIAVHGENCRLVIHREGK